jgi:hypothetical protein
MDADPGGPSRHLQEVAGNAIKPWSVEENGESMSTRPATTVENPEPGQEGFVRNAESHGAVSGYGTSAPKPDLNSPKNI